MSQTIEAPAEADVERIAQQIVHAQQLVEQVTGKRLTGGLADLALLQATLDAGLVEPEATWSLQALGMAFGKVFVENNEGYDWWMVEDEYGRDPAVRYGETTLLVFPQTMISKRVEDGEAVAMRELYDGLRETLDEVRAGHYPGD